MEEETDKSPASARVHDVLQQLAREGHLVGASPQAMVTGWTMMGEVIHEDGEKGWFMIHAPGQDFNAGMGQARRLALAHDLEWINYLDRRD